MAIKLKNIKEVSHLLPGDLVSSRDDIKTDNPVAFVVSVDYSADKEKGSVIFMMLGEDRVYEGHMISDHYFLFYRHKSS